MDRPGVRQVPEGNGEQRRMEETDCEIICGAQRPSQLRDWWWWWVRNPKQSWQLVYWKNIKIHKRLKRKLEKNQTHKTVCKLLVVFTFVVIINIDCYLLAGVHLKGIRGAVEDGWVTKDASVSDLMAFVSPASSSWGSMMAVDSTSIMAT